MLLLVTESELWELSLGYRSDAVSVMEGRIVDGMAESTIIVVKAVVVDEAVVAVVAGLVVDLRVVLTLVVDVVGIVAVKNIHELAKSMYI